ncbi:MAG: hypothetical protein KF863_21335 [Rubrivivax sp.]|nr:hypothetical protein [Rubrivivax sp.]
MTAAALAAAVLLSGCETRTRVQLQTVSVEVPVPCRAALPDRPVMPTESLAPGVPLDTFAAAAAAEMERREGYEQQLLAALEECRR